MAATPTRNIPDHLLVEIFSRLPATSLLSLRYGCRAWHAITRDPFFVSLHRRRAIAASGKTRATYVFLRSWRRVNRHSYEITPAGYLHRQEITWHPLYKEEVETRDASVGLISHCRGLTVITLTRSYEFMDVSVHNLTTGESRVVAGTVKRKCKFELGFDRRTGRYKLLCMTPIRVQPQLMIYDESYFAALMKVEVYTLGDTPHTWRRLPDYRFPMRTKSRAANCNGNPHWLSFHEYDNVVEVVWFDTAGEGFHTMPGPRGGKLEGHGDGFYTMLFTWAEETLCTVTCSDHRSVMDFWVLEEEGRDGAWSLRWRIPLGHPNTSWHDVVGPWPGGEVLVLTDTRVVTLRPGHGHRAPKEVTLLEDGNRFWSATAFTHIETLVSLRDLWDEGRNNYSTTPVVTTMDDGMLPRESLDLPA